MQIRPVFTSAERLRRITARVESELQRARGETVDLENKAYAAGMRYALRKVLDWIAASEKEG